MLARTHLVVEANPIERALPHLEVAGLAPGFARLAFHLLRQAAGAAADENFRALATSAHAIGVTEVQQQVDTIKQLVDPTSFLSLTHGLCEIASFDASLATKDFYQGVNVAPGHVGAGLVFERPELTASLLEALEAKHAVLVAGPSGSGKSALSWLAAFHSRHAVRWYRLRQIGRDDVGKIVGLAKLLDAGAERPVGFVVDDVGHEGTAGWDLLALECESVPGLLAIGTVREEDMFRLETASRLPIIRPRLDEPLAIRLWQELTSSGASQFRFWREPFELSRGLLLEYTHLLTEGRRLQDTLDEQVRRRLSEHRDDELTVLRTVSFAASHGGAVDQQRLLSVLNWERPRMARALSRLVDEHAIRVSEGALLGLHDIRSTYLDNRLRELLGVPVEDQLTDAVSVLMPAHFAPFVVHVLRRWPEATKSLQAALAKRASEGDTTCWTPIFHGLGLATADLIASRWIEISRECGVDDRFSSLAMTFALSGVDALENVPAFTSITSACRKFRSVLVDDLRWPVLEQLKPPTAQVLPLLETYHQLIASLLKLNGATPFPVSFAPFEADLPEGQPTVLLDVARTIRELGLKSAMDFVEKWGGCDALLDRLYRELPWVTRPSVSFIDGETVVEGHVRFMPDAQPDTHGAVVRYCELMMAAVPEANRVICNAIGPDGNAVGLGAFKIATKNMVREALPDPARIAWNRAQLRGVQRVVGAPQMTARISNLAELIDNSAVRLGQAAELYCRLEKADPKWSLLNKVSGWINNYIPPPQVDEAVANPLSKGAYSTDDDIARFVTGVHELTEKLSSTSCDKPGLLALRACDLARDSEKLLDTDLWRFAASPPLKAIRNLRAALLDIRAVLGDHSNNPARHHSDALRFARSSRSRSALARAAAEAKVRAEQSTADYIRRLAAAFGTLGLEMKVYARPIPQDRGYRWPDIELAGLLVVNSPMDWLKSIEQVPGVLSDFENHPKFFCAPLLNGVVAPMAVQLIESLMPCQDFAEQWSEIVPFPMLEDGALQSFTYALDSITNLSSIFQNQDRPLNEIEEHYAAKQVEIVKDAVNRLSALCRDHSDDDLEQAGAFLMRTIHRVSNQAEAGASIAEEMLGALKGRTTEFVTEALCHRMALVERAIQRVAVAPPP